MSQQWQVMENKKTNYQNCPVLYTADEHSDIHTQAIHINDYCLLLLWFFASITCIFPIYECHSFCQQGHVGSKTPIQKIRQFLTGSAGTQVDLYSGCQMAACMNRKDGTCLTHNEEKKLVDMSSHLLTKTLPLDWRWWCGQAEMQSQALRYDHWATWLSDSLTQRQTHKSTINIIHLFI